MECEGICNSDMQKDVKKFIANEKLSICTVIETHLKEKQIKKVCDFIYGDWNWYSNMKESDKGCRIIIGWNQAEVNVMPLHSSHLAILCAIENRENGQQFFCRFVYAANTGRERKVLWNNLKRYKSLVKNRPWVLMGDWNVSLHNGDHSEGGSCKTNDMIDFQECLDHIEVEDINSTRVHFTWVQSRLNPNNGILKKIDKSLGKH